MALPTPLQAFSGVPKINTAPDKQTIVDGEKMTGAQALIRSLEDLGVEDVFGIPGGAILPVYHEIKDNTKFRFVLMRHEQAAGHAAEGYALATGKVGVCIVTSGPGATNVVTAIADANMDSVPMVVITGQVGVQAIGTDAFQEADIVGITYPVSKHSFLVTRAQDIPRVLSEAYYIANTGRPGPVVVDLTKTAQTGDMYYSWPQRMILPGYNPTTKAHGRVLSDAAKLFSQSYRPVLYVGGGAARSNAGAPVQALAALPGAPADLCGFTPARRSWYYDRFLKHSGWYPDRLLRVFRRNGVHFTQSGAHEHIDPNGRTRELDGDILHYPYKHFREHLDKINSYAQQGADDLAARGKKGGLALGVLHGIGRFLRIYLLKKGFLDGKAGFINAVHGAFYAFLKYVRVDEGNWGFPYNHR